MANKNKGKSLICKINRFGKVSVTGDNIFIPLFKVLCDYLLSNHRAKLLLTPNNLI